MRIRHPVICECRPFYGPDLAFRQRSAAELPHEFALRIVDGQCNGGRRLALQCVVEHSASRGICFPPEFPAAMAARRNRIATFGRNKSCCASAIRESNCSSGVRSFKSRINHLQPRYISPPHFGAYREIEEELFWRRDYPQELKLHLVGEFQQRYQKLSQGQMFGSGSSR